MLFIKIDLDAHWTREEKTDKVARHILDSPVCVHGIKSVLCKRCLSKIGLAAPVFKETMELECKSVPDYESQAEELRRVVRFSPRDIVDKEEPIIPSWKRF